MDLGKCHVPWEPRKCHVPWEPMLGQHQERLRGELTLPLPQTVIDILEYLNKKKLQKLRCELKEWEEKEESKMKRKNPRGEFLDPLPDSGEVSRAFVLHLPFGNQWAQHLPS